MTQLPLMNHEREGDSSVGWRPGARAPLKSGPEVTHWTGSLISEMQQLAYLIVGYSPEGAHSQRSSSSNSRERATITLGPVRRTSLVPSISLPNWQNIILCLKVKDQNCCLRSRFSSSAPEPAWGAYSAPQTP